MSRKGLEIVQEVYTNRFPKCHQTSHALLLSLLVSHMCYFRVGWVLGPSHLVIRQLLIMSGDVELNPGPLDHEIEEILSQVDNTTFDEDDWNIVIDECSSLAAKWEQLSGFLGLRISVIDTIKQNHPGDIIGCWNEALKQWIKQNYNTLKFGVPSWRSLLTAVTKVEKLKFKKLAADHQLAAVSIPVQRAEKDNEKISPSAPSIDTGSSESKDTTVEACDPAAGSQQCSGFATLVPDQLSKEEKEQLHQKLYTDSEDMMYKFQQLFSATSKSLKERSVPATSLTSHLQCLGSIKPTFKDSGLPPLRHKLPGLANAETVDAVMSVIGDYCSFFNYRMLEHIINELGVEQDKQNLAKYKEDFAEYGERHVFECPSEVGKMSEEGHANMFVTLDDSFDNCTVNHLQSFISNLRKTLNISSNIELKLCRIESGSLKLTFQLPHFVQQDIFPLSSDQEADVAHLGVMQLSCGDYHFTRREIVEVEDRALVEDLDHTDNEGSISSIQACDAESYQDDGDYKRHNLDSLRELHAQRSLATQSLSSYSRKLTDISNIEFFFPLADEFKCPVCMTLINEPQLTSCGHRFCKDCIDPVTQEPNPECPICNEPKFNMMPDRSIVRKINSLKIHCINREDGCQWTGELATLDNHLEEQCSISVSEVSSKFESLGCKEKTTQRDVDAHVSGELLSHVTSFMEMFEAHQKAFQHILDENSARIRQVEQYVDQVEEKITRDLNNKSCIKWNDINLHRLFELKTGDRASVKRCLVPDRLVPNEAREVLFLVVMHSGNTSQFPSSTQHISLYVEEAGMHYTKYLHFTSYKQDAWNSNTENMWLPMPSDRMVHVHVPIDLKSNIRCNIFLAGYR